MSTHLVVPGLLGHLPRLGETGQLPRFPQLELLLSRGDLRPSPADYQRTLFNLFELASPADADVPTAAVCYHAESAIEPLPDTYLLHADPLHLRPDQDRLLAFDFHHQPLTDEEGRQFADAFNRHFAADGLRLLIPHNIRWYLAVDTLPALHTRALGEVLGRNLDLFLPQGDDARTWRVWLNEIQMLFHSLPINETREAQGQLPVSGLWFSGGGVLPSQAAVGFAETEGECILARGLQRLSTQNRAGRLVLDHAQGRAVFDASPQHWIEAVAQLDDRLASYLDGELWLYPCEGRAWHWKPAMRRRLWRRCKPLGDWLS